MRRAKKYLAELREGAVRLVFEQQTGSPRGCIKGLWADLIRRPVLLASIVLVCIPWHPTFAQNGPSWRSDDCKTICAKSLLDQACRLCISLGGGLPELEEWTPKKNQLNCEFQLPKWLVDRWSYLPNANTATYEVSLRELGCTLSADGWSRADILDMWNILTFAPAACRGQEIHQDFWLSMWPDEPPLGPDLSQFAGDTARDFCTRNARHSQGNDHSSLQFEHNRFAREWFCAVHLSIAHYGGFTPGIGDFRKDIDRLCTEVRSGKLSVADGYRQAQEAHTKYYSRLPAGSIRYGFNVLKWFVEKFGP